MTLESLLAQGETFDFDNEKYIEFHVDNIHELPFLQKFCNETGQVKPFKGFQSHFRENKEKKVLVMLGQEETTCTQYLTNSLTWHGSNEEFRLVPKDEGGGFMVSLICSQEFGIGFEKFWDGKLQVQVNKFRKNKTYHDKEASIASQKHINKIPLEGNPFLRLFEYGHGATK